MTQKTYKTASGRVIDLGALILKNEEIRAVGNMNVNARGDVLNQDNKIIDKKSQQVQRRYSQQTNITNPTLCTSNIEARKIAQEKKNEEQSVVETPINEVVTDTGLSGLEAAIARARLNNTEE